MKKKILIISGSRAEFGLLESVINELMKSHLLEPEVLITGMHTLKKYGETIKNIKKKDYKISSVIRISPRGNMLLWLSEEIKGIMNYCLKKHIDCILVLGDRDEPFAGAIVGAHLGIPVAHIHGGDVSGETAVDNRLRNCITELSTYHFAATKKSAERIIVVRGKKNVYVVGAPGIDAIKNYPKTTKKNLSLKYSLSLKERWIIVLLHPETLEKNTIVDDQIKSVINSILKIGGEKIWIYPNSDTGSVIFINHLKKFKKNMKNIHVFKNLEREDFLNFLKYSDILIGNSSSGIIESTFFHIPVVNIGRRQEGRERSTNVIDVPYDSNKISKAIKKAFSKEFKNKVKKLANFYGDGFAGERIRKILEKKLCKN